MQQSRGITAKPKSGGKGFGSRPELRKSTRFRPTYYFFRSAHATRAGADKKVAELKDKGHDAIVREKKVGRYRYRVWEKTPGLFR